MRKTLIFLQLIICTVANAQNFSDRVSVSGMVNIDWTYQENWGGSAAKWAGYIGFNSYRTDNMKKDYYLRSNNYTKRMVFEGNHYGFRWLGEESIVDNGKSTEALKLSSLMTLSSSGNLTLGSRDKNDKFGSGSILIFGGTEWNSDPTEIYRFAVSPDVTQLRVRVGDGLSNSDKFIVGTAGNNAGNWATSMAVTAGGRVGIKNETPTCELDVAGTIKAHEIEVTLASINDMQLNGTLAANNITYTANGNTADFVFEDNYNLKDLSEVEAFIKNNKHLPEIPSAAAMEEAGVNLAEMNKLLLMKVEELTLYVIEQKAEAQKNEVEVERLKAEVNVEREERRAMRSEMQKMTESQKRVIELEERLAKLEALSSK